MDRREQELSISINIEDREEKKNNLICSVFYFLVATSKTQQFNPWLYSLSYFALGAAIDL